MTQNNVEFLEQIAQLLENLPSEQLLPQAKTPDQIEEWQSQRRGNKILAECWRAKFISHCDAPINQALDRKEINQLKYDGIWLLVKQYKVLWDIVQLAEPYVKQVHSDLQSLWELADINFIPLPKEFIHIFQSIVQKEYSFCSAFELYIEILKEMENRRFLDCFKGYQEISISKSEEGLKQVREIFDQGMLDGFYPLLNAIETKNLKNNFSGDDFQMSWMTMTIFACQFAVSINSSLKDRLDKFNELVVEMCKLGATACRKRESKTWRKPRSFAWKNGKRIYGSKNGGIYRES
ncbi:hypothetical protein [Floridanema evergladense]|uniref:Uncharacterized protein n=1 Tax=Floridaenema evergladense BLCC-F167 TaxID=3153639 RepID=A0ABV4WNS2_9CYAN